MKGAVIDLGTNTFSLVIFEKEGTQQTVLHTDKSFVNIGEGGINFNRITEKAIARAQFAFTHFMDACRSYKITSENIRAFGTSALRSAENADEFIDDIQHKFNIKITIISGNQEAQLIYKGVRSIHPFTEDFSCIFDIGGGSTEFIFTQKEKLYSQKSFNIGISRIIQLFNLSDPLTTRDKEQIIQFLEEQTEGYFKTANCTALIGSAGSFETFYHLIFDRATYDENTTYQLPAEELKKTLKVLISSSFKERDKMHWIANYRKTMIHVAALKTKWVLNQLQVECFYFSPAALKEGVITSV